MAKSSNHFPIGYGGRGQLQPLTTTSSQNPHRKFSRSWHCSFGILLTVDLRVGWQIQQNSYSTVHAWVAMGLVRIPSYQRYFNIMLAESPGQHIFPLTFDMCNKTAGGSPLYTKSIPCNRMIMEKEKEKERSEAT